LGRSENVGKLLQGNVQYYISVEECSFIGELINALRPIRCYALLVVGRGCANGDNNILTPMKFLK
jgi:hypothetical protein